MKSLIRILIIAALIIPASSHAANFPNPQTRGVWISGNYLQGGPTAIESMMRKLSAANFNTIYVDVWYQGYTIYPSKVVQAAGGQLQNPVFSGTDPLKVTIQIAHKYGIRVFAWFEYGFMVGHSSDSLDVPGILKRHPNWAMVQRDTTKNFFHNVYGYFYAVDPSVTAASDFIVSLYTECAKNYPGLDGIETDIENDTTVSYSDTSRIRFMQETGNPDPLTLPNNNQAWISWRRLQITDVVRRIYAGVKDVNPSCVVSAAVPPPYMSSYMLESWGVWAKSWYIDMAEPMLYLSTSSFSNQLDLCSSYIPEGFPLSVGIDMSSAGSVPNTITEMKQAESRNVSGVTLWYYGYLSTYPNAFADIKSSLFQSKTMPSYDDRLMDNGSPGLFRSVGSWTLMKGGFDGNYESSPAAPGDSAVFSVRILRAGTYSLYGYWSGDSASNCRDAFIKAVSPSAGVLDTVNETRNVGTWNYIAKLQLNSGDTVRVCLTGSGSGNLIADAFRLRRETPFELSDYAVPDSQSVLMKFSDPLLSPPSPLTTVTSSLTNTDLSFYVDPSDNTILHIAVPTLQQGVPFTLNVDGLVDNSYDTLSFSKALAYDPDSTMSVIDNQSAGLFARQSGVWSSDTGGESVNGGYLLAKDNSSVERVQWGAVQVKSGGYYDVYAHIPKTSVPLTNKCLYIVLYHFGTDSVFVSQAASEGTWKELGNLPYSQGDPFAVSLSTIPGVDTSMYTAADAVMLVRSVQVTGIKGREKIPKGFAIYENYPNPFNPSTVISFRISSEAKVSIVIYNSLGQRVERLAADRTYGPGEWNVTFNAAGMSSGLYFASVSIRGSGVDMRKVLKMLLIK